MVMMLTVETFTELSLADSSSARLSESSPDGMTGSVKDTFRSPRSFWSSAIALDRSATDAESVSASPRRRSRPGWSRRRRAPPYAAASALALPQTSASSLPEHSAERDTHTRAGLLQRRDPGLRGGLVDGVRAVPLGRAVGAVGDHEGQVVHGSETPSSPSRRPPWRSRRARTRCWTRCWRRTRSRRAPRWSGGAREVCAGATSVVPTHRHRRRQSKQAGEPGSRPQITPHCVCTRSRDFCLRTETKCSPDAKVAHPRVIPEYRKYMGNP